MRGAVETTSLRPQYRGLAESLNNNTQNRPPIIVHTQTQTTGVGSDTSLTVNTNTDREISVIVLSPKVTGKDQTSISPWDSDKKLSGAGHQNLLPLLRIQEAAWKYSKPMHSTKPYGLNKQKHRRKPSQIRRVPQTHRQNGENETELSSSHNRETVGANQSVLSQMLMPSSILPYSVVYAQGAAADQLVRNVSGGDSESDVDLLRMQIAFANYQLATRGASASPTDLNNSGGLPSVNQLKTKETPVSNESNSSEIKSNYVGNRAKVLDAEAILRREKKRIHACPFPACGKIYTKSSDRKSVV